jgi:UDP-N-acetylmuramoylalanyl-D-glutamate--2,6-diaminopimelate ligase (EC 6.3.2.13)
MEVSSHALAQDRAWGCSFAAAVWTNLTQDHLDFHGSMENYWQAKATLFRQEYLQGRAVINADDAGGRRLLQAIRPDLQPWAYSLQPLEGIPALWPGDVQVRPNGLQATLHTPLGTLAVEAPLVGSFNLSNLLAAVGVALHLGIPLSSSRRPCPVFPEYRGEWSG